MAAGPAERFTSPPSQRRGRIETAVTIGVFVLLVIGCLWVLAPFITAILWAALLCLSTWGLYVRVLALSGNRRSLAALVMTLTIAAVAVVPFVIVGESLADNVSDVVLVIRRTIENGPANPPEYLANLPLVGPHIRDYLEHLSSDPAARKAFVVSFAGGLRTVAIALGKALGHGIAEISLSLLICFFLYRDGDSAARRLRYAVNRIAGEHGGELLAVAETTVKGVVYGVIGTSIIQGLLCGIGLWIAGVPGAFLLGFATFLLAFLPMGPALIWLPASIWLYETRSAGWAVFMLLWGGLAVGSMDHFAKPLLISRTGSAPLLLVMLGVIGGAIAFGFIGVFIGPTLLAVGYAVLNEWSDKLEDVRE
jgi:predicted PurR-regulated permease PerM